MHSASPLRQALRQAAVARRAALQVPAGPATAHASASSSSYLLRNQAQRDLLAHAPAPGLRASSSRCFSQCARAANKEAAEGSKQSEKANEAACDAKNVSEGTASGEAHAEVEKLKTELKEKDARIKELSDAVLYSKADLQNLQRRSAEEKAAAGDYAITRLAKDLTSSIDILHLALNSVPEGLRSVPAAGNSESPEDSRKAIAELYSGVDLTRKSLLEMLKMHGITAFDPTGEKFNPQEHEAMYQAPVPGKEPGTVLECNKVGFRIKNRLLRAAQVGVVQDSA
ncbi:GrpE-domain-containing protein [Tilletiaria anomala UBC 951]|uniref:GrpE protein homolog n=1 Tax=Tilletiaria anomala (strain ATCC 24038 / CBS 436.72 / UBC 951) TaxID=1037660 RepID=A0A066WME9_TILAU|nr:GrpE-domain-containing protein [Tilletiaria anomala UBC 951]KDN52179.1 GrpE-domain-containing protein [Tilletiaria anomala UBC 951]